MSINTNQAISFFAWASFRGELSLSDLHADNAKSVLNEHATVRLSDKEHFFLSKNRGFIFFPLFSFFHRTKRCFLRYFGLRIGRPSFEFTKRVVEIREIFFYISTAMERKNIKKKTMPDKSLYDDRQRSHYHPKARYSIKTADNSAFQ